MHASAPVLTVLTLSVGLTLNANIPGFGSEITIRAESVNRYLSLDSADSNKVKADAIEALGDDERFIIEDAGDGFINLRSKASGRYIQRPSNSSLMTATSDAPSSESAQFRWIDEGGSGSSWSFAPTS